MKRTLYTKDFPSTVQAVGGTLAEALDALVKDNWFTAEHSFCVRLCLEEALVNAVQHGNKNDPGRRVNLEIFEQDGRCVIQIRDEGEGFDPLGVTMPDCETLGGRGVCLIKHYMDDVSFDLAEKCLKMQFSRNTFACEVS